MCTKWLVLTVKSTIVSVPHLALSLYIISRGYGAYLDLYSSYLETLVWFMASPMYMHVVTYMYMYM